MATSFLDRVHWVEPARRKRTKPMRVLALGVSRSGTESLSKALEVLGFETYHPHKKIVRENDHSDDVAWVIAGRTKFECLSPAEGGCVLDTAFFDSILGPYDAICGFPGHAFPRELIAAYPDAKVILNTRNVDAWWPSFAGPILRVLKARSSFFASILFNLSPTGYWQSKLIEHLCAFWRVSNAAGFKEAKGKWVYEDHSALVRGAVPKDRLLEWQVHEGYEKLCSFLEVPIPDSPFPNGNSRLEMDAKMRRLTLVILKEALRNLLILSSGTAAIISAIAFVVSRYKILRRWKR